MDFQQALELLKQNRPDLYTQIGQCIIYPTQDRIDAILAEIGWEYEIFWYANLNPEWGWRAQNRDEAILLSVDDTYEDVWFLTKLEAAKAALIAVVEKKYGE